MATTAGEVTTTKVTPFTNEPLTDFTNPEHIAAQEAALRSVAAEFGKTYPLIIGGERRMTAETFTSNNPAHPDQALATFAKAGIAEANEAVEAAHKRFKTWQYTPAEERAGICSRRRSGCASAVSSSTPSRSYEAGKSWAEADGDVAEGIDFLEFYAREALRLAEKQPVTPLPGEETSVFYIPLGVGAIIPPWNFPGAIMIGLTSSALVAGNTVVLKPATATPWVAAKFVELLEEVGVPSGVVSFLPGSGAVMGDTLRGIR